MAQVLRERREKHRFLLTAWVLLPDRWHAIVYPHPSLTISWVMDAVKVGSTLRLRKAREASGLFWQPRFSDRTLRTVKEYNETVEYIHLNPVRRGLVQRAEDWEWSSADECGGRSPEQPERRCGLAIDRARLPADERARI